MATRPRAGADGAAVIASILRTADQQHVDPIDVLADMQRTRGIPDLLDLPIAAAAAGGWWQVAMTPRIRPRPGVRYRVVVTENHRRP